MVREYQIQFENITNHIKGINEAFIRSYFISRLKKEIQVKIKIFNPSNIIIAIMLTKLVEDKFNAKCKHAKKPF